MEVVDPGGFHGLGIGLLCILLGAAMLVFKWQPPSIPLHPPADPDRARIAEARVVIGLGTLVALHGFGMLVLPVTMFRALLPYWGAAMVVATLGGLAYVFRAARPAR